MGYAGNEQDGFAALMNDVNTPEVSETNIEPAVEVVENTPTEQVVETRVDEQVMDSAQTEVAPLISTETPNLRQVAPQMDTETPAIDYEQKFKTVEGMLRAQSGEAKERLATVEAKLEAERNARIEAEQKLAEVPLDYQEIMGDEAFEDLGEDAVNGITRLVEAKMESKYEGKIKSLEGIIGNMQDGIAQKSADEEANKEQNKGTLHDNRILAEVPEFFKLTKDQEFVKYLEANKDPLTQISLRTAFEDADSAMDSVIVANICKMYIKARDAKSAEAYKLSEHVAPTINSQSPEPVDKPIMKMAEYNVMVDKLMNQKITDAQWDVFNRNFELAKKEGRVQ